MTESCQFETCDCMAHGAFHAALHWHRTRLVQHRLPCMQEMRACSIFQIRDSSICCWWQLARALQAGRQLDPGKTSSTETGLRKMCDPVFQLEWLWLVASTNRIGTTTSLFGSHHIWIRLAAEGSPVDGLHGQPLSFSQRSCCSSFALLYPVPFQPPQTPLQNALPAGQQPHD